MLAHKYLKQPWVRNSVTLQMRKLGFERGIGMWKRSHRVPGKTWASPLSSWLTVHS